MVAKSDAKSSVTKTGKNAKGGKSKKSAKKNISHRTALLLDGLPVSDMSRDQLLSHLTRLLDQLEKEREERNFFQLERDQIYGFWKVAKEEVEDARARLRNKEKELDDAEEQRQKDVAVYKQQIKCLLHEHQTILTETRAEQQSALEMAHLQYQEKERELRAEQQVLKEDIRKLGLDHQQVVDKIKMEHAQEMALLKKNLDQDARQLEIKFENRIEAQRNELEKRRKNDLKEIDTNDQEHVAVLRANHDHAIIDLKNYFNDIILNNMTLINAMKEQMNEFRNKEERLEKQYQYTNREIKQLRERSEILERKNKELEKESENWALAKSSLQATKGQQKILLTQLKEAVWMRDVAEQNLAKVERDKEELESRFMAAILEVQQKANLKQLVLEKKLETLQESLQSKELQLKQILSVSSNSHADVGTRSSGDDETGSSARERRKQTIVKMNFEADRLDDGVPDKSFQSSSESIVIEEKLSLRSESIRSAISSAKSASAAITATVGEAKKTSLRKLLSAQ